MVGMSAIEKGAPFAWRRWLRRGVMLCALMAVGGVGLEAWHIFGGNNVHAVIPDRVYRSAQLSPAGLERIVHHHGIRTVINLRGYCAPQEWYLDEARTTHRLNIDLEDIGLSAGRFPSTRELRRLLEVLDHTEYPVLLHCKQGADRTGLISAFILLLQTNATLAEAKWQLSPRYGHVAIGRPGNLDRFFQLYGDWLQREGKEHAPAQLRAWLAEADCPMEYRGTIEPVDFPRTLRANHPVALHVRATNRSRSPWTFQADSNTGYHACFTLRGPDGMRVTSGRVGLFDAVLPPNDTMELTLPLPALSEPGRYHLTVDMVDEAHCIFQQTGAEPLEWEFEVRSQESGVGSQESRREAGS
jgi:protein tyrosine phosphatase (PTP) superfamily phosphohydrolase (DUF442 family)